MALVLSLSIPELLLSSFWDKVKITPGCWEWMAQTSSNGYGKISFARQFGFTTYAHRLSWIIHFGPIPQGINVLHKCDHPSCVNPDHLFLGTQADNVSDMCKKGRNQYIAHRGEENGNARLTKNDIINIRASHKTRKELSTQYGISKSMVGKIITFRSWNDDED